MIRFYLNDAEVIVENASPSTTLLNFLRQERRLTGTKEGCAEGDCGACTVVVLDRDEQSRPLYRAVNSCLLLVGSLAGHRLYTVEGISDGGALHPVQQAMVDELGSQCGYCTPGFVMSLFEASYRDDLDAGWKTDDQLCGNLCRCTGYRPIRKAFEKTAGKSLDDRFGAQLQCDLAPLTHAELSGRSGHYLRPVDLAGVFAAAEQHPEHRLVAGATDLGLEITQRGARPNCLIDLQAVAELNGIDTHNDRFSIGAAVSLADLERFSSEHLPTVHRMLRYFGARQIKHRATLGGNLVNASPIGDMAPVFLALGADVIIATSKGLRSVSLEEFFVAYRTTALLPGELVARIDVPRPDRRALHGAYKVSKRRELDISAVACAFNVSVDEAGIVRSARLAYGGMAATPMRAKHAETMLLDKLWDAPHVEAAANALSDDFTPLSDHRSSAWYRQTVAANLLKGFFLETQKDVFKALPDRPTGTVVLPVNP
jgi:xanthine dehydrogenase small subunit